MITEIGIIAGEIWRHLDFHGRAELDDVVTGIDRTRDMTLMSLGWLAREGHVLVETRGDCYHITLRKPQSVERP